MQKSKFRYGDRVRVGSVIPCAFMTDAILGKAGEIVGAYEHPSFGFVYEVKFDNCLHTQSNLGIAIVYEVSLGYADAKVFPMIGGGVR